MGPKSPSGRLLMIAAACGLALLLLERLALVLIAPELVHDFDPGELKMMDLALFGLPSGEGLTERLHRWLAGPENIHHGGYPVLSLLYLPIEALFGPSLASLRLLGIAASIAAAALCTSWLVRQSGPLAGLLGLALWLGAPPLFLKWNCTVRGGHLEAIALVSLLLFCLQSALDQGGQRRWLIAGTVAGFSVYFSYLALPAAIVLTLGALAQEKTSGSKWAEIRPVLRALFIGGLIGFSPWLFGLIVLDLPYFGATIHASANPTEAATVRGRSLLETLSFAVTALPQNLWPWTVSEAIHTAYSAPEPDILDYRVTGVEWLVRLGTALLVITGLLAALRKRAYLALAFFSLPAAHYLFIMRAGNQPGYPIMPHRYLVLVFPAVAAAAGYGAASCLEAAKTSGMRAGAKGLILLLMVLGLQGFLRHATWLSSLPITSTTEVLIIPKIREAGLGRIRADEAPQLLEALDAPPTEAEHAYWRGMAKVYAPLADYYLLFRSDRRRPYPSGLFSQNPPDGDGSRELGAEARGALWATQIRAGSNDGQLHSWIQSWEPSKGYREAICAVLKEEGLSRSQPACTANQAAQKAD